VSNETMVRPQLSRDQGSSAAISPMYYRDPGDAASQHDGLSSTTDSLSRDARPASGNALDFDDQADLHESRKSRRTTMAT
jgi:hypothetical protein